MGGSLPILDPPAAITPLSCLSLLMVLCNYKATCVYRNHGRNESLVAIDFGVNIALTNCYKNSKLLYGGDLDAGGTREWDAGGTQGGHRTP